MSWILARAKEPSTWSGVAAIVMGMSFLPHAADVASSIPVIGTCVAGLLGIWLKEAA